MPASLLLLKAYGLTECRTHTFYAPFLGLANAFFQTIGYPGLCHFHGVPSIFSEVPELPMGMFLRQLASQLE